MTALALVKKDGTLAMEMKVEGPGTAGHFNTLLQGQHLDGEAEQQKERKRLGVNIITAIPVASLSWVTNPPQWSIVE